MWKLFTTFLPVYSTFFSTFLRGLKNLVNQDQGILINFKRLFVNHPWPPFWHIDCSIYKRYERNLSNYFF